MGQYDLHSIALFLAGQYPNLFSDSYDKLDFKIELRDITSDSITESVTDEMQRTAKNDKDFFYMWLHRLQKITREGSSDRDVMWEFLEKLDKEIPKKLYFINWVVLKDLPNIKEFAITLKTMWEAEFSRTIVLPILQKMWYENVEYKWTVRESDRGADFYVMKSNLLSGLEVYTWVQVKSVTLTNGSSSNPWSEYSKLVQEVNHAFTSKHILFDWREIRIDEMLVLNSRDVRESVRVDFFKAEWVEWRKVRMRWRDWVLSLMKDLWMIL